MLQKVTDKEAQVLSSGQAQVKAFRGQILLNPGISYLNFISFNIYQLLAIFTFVSVDVLQPNLLGSADYYNIPLDRIADVNTTVLLWDFIVKVVVAPFYGICCDKYGRKPVMLFGLISMAIGIAMFPFGTSVFPYVVFARVIFANGAMAAIVIPLLADYVDYDTKGRAAGLLVFGSAFGGVFSSDYCLTLSTSWTYTTTYLVLASITLGVGLINSFGIKNGRYHVDLSKDEKWLAAQRLALDAERNERSLSEANSTQESSIELLETDEKKLTFKEKLFIGIQQARNPWVLIGYIVYFLARGDTALLSFSLVIWSQSYFPDTTVDQNNAANKAYLLSGVAYSVLALTAIFFGFYSDKYSKYKILIVSYVTTILGTFFIIIADGPEDSFAYISMVFIGFGLSGLDCSSLQLIQKYAEPKFRAGVNALGSLFSVCGLVSVSIGGGYLMAVNINAAYILYMIFSIISLLITMYLYHRNPSMKVT